VEAFAFMVEKLAREFHVFHYLRRNRISSRNGSSSRHEEMTMIALFLFRSLAAGLTPWLLKLATWLLARSLNMPEPLVHSTGAFVFAQVLAVENSLAQSLCPLRLARRLLAWWRQTAV
jgi:hypothetical protein